ncbi:tRNA pseudouridine(38-40) synthase TruA [Haliea sp. AH-315-K21]|uniref:tRNA pseudouridine synthase A n=1 Tax=SAR86 cluster bacterium TaxID=2030880 RepID=A0A2A5CEI4_9GAMM|nr:tRNA pseudouridine(38-40) synthase TruA [Haliea sp. AH-315-K21]MBN4059789.1 tRNA pseudouridine(38-40) synthase TruA [bacterium AH-315-I11]MBN4075193.1 tRNA pseudouridine(38-40) synthase TruA [Gammaproteobacteria bacterium AH-315-E17]PCJ42143.1 MAG: tRNA pseudouridine(38-40) synthase TruA [SAR86 cluster bacterium]
MGWFIGSEAGTSASSRIALCIEYQGTGFNGWQAQRSAAVSTVQEALELAISKVADQSIKVYCAGRTDKGVHASAQIVHFDTTSERPLKAWVRGCNALLPKTVVVRWAKQVDENFHARFSAFNRRYCYLIYNNKTPTALLQSLVSPHFFELNEKSMHEAGQYLLGERDFSSFRGAGCQANTAMRNVIDLKVSRDGDFVMVDIKANAFLLHMVRNIVGALLEVGEGRRKPEWMKQVLELKDRRQAGITASPEGLYLVEVGYPDRYELPIAPWVLPFFKSH